MKRPFKKLTAWLCCMAMLISFIPATALPVFADEAVALTQTEGTLAAGNYVLSGDLALTGKVTIAKNTEVTIDLAGNDITGTVYPFFDVGGKLTITDSTATGTPGTNYVSGTITGGTNTSNDNYGMIFVSNGEFTLEGGKLTGYTHTGGSNRGGAISALNASIVNINGGEITGNTAYRGGGVFVTNSAVANISGGAIYGNTATNYGGGVHADTKDNVVNINGGVIRNNTATRGSEVCMGEATANTLNITGGTVSTALTGSYDGIYSHTGTVNISGGDISRVYWRYGTVNVSGGTIGALRAGANATTPHYMYITGNPVIGSLTLDSGYDQDIGNELSITELTEGATITLASASYSTYITKDNTSAYASKVYTYTAPALPVSGTVDAGEYKLTGDHVLTNTLVIAAGTEVVIDLAGNTISMPDRDAQYITVNGKLTIKDSVGGGVVQFKTTTGGSPAIGIGNASTEAVFVLEGGELNGWQRAGAGGCIYMYEGSTFIMTGGLITDCDATGASVIRSAGGGQTLTITGGTITGNDTGGNIIGLTTATGANPATVTIGGTANISGNTINEAAYTSSNHELQFKNADITISGTATVGYLYNDGDVETEGVDGYPYSSIAITGAPVVSGVRWSAGARTPVTVKELTDGAEIKMLAKLSGSQIDDTVEVSGPDADSKYVYTWLDPATIVYPVEIGTVDNGTVTVEPAEGVAGTEVTVTATPAEGYELEAILVNGEAIDGTNFLIVAGDNVVTATFKAVDVSLPTSGTVDAGEYTLAADHVLTNTLTIKSDVTIDLAGKTISMPDVDGVYFNITAEGKLTIKDSVGGGKVQFKNTAAGHGGISITGTLVLEGGELNGWTRVNGGTYGAGGMLNMYPDSTFTMTGGTITGAECASNCVIRCHSGGGGINVTITGGSITGNNTSGGAIMTIVGTDANPSYLTIAGNANVSGNTCAGAAFVKEEIYGQFTHITVGGTATVGALYDRASAEVEGVEGYPYGSINISGSATVEDITLNSSTYTPVTINDLTEGAAITTKLELGASRMDETVVMSGPDADGVYTYAWRDPATVYTVTVGEVENGAISVDPAEGVYGTSVTINAEPAEGYVIGTFYVDGKAIAGATFTITGNHEVTATFVEAAVETYDVVVIEPAGGSVSVDKNNAAEGETITVTAEADEGYELTAILVNGEAIEGTTFTMPAASVQVTATFTEVVADGTLPTSGSVAAGEYVLEATHTLTGVLNVEDVNVVIDLAGQTLNAAEGGGAFAVYGTGSLTILDSVGGGKIVSGESAGTPAVSIQGGTFTLQGGEITGWNRAGAAGGMIFLAADTTFNMEGGKLTGANAGYGAAIRINGAGAVVNMSGGEISGNAATGSYGPIYMAAGTTFNMTDGTITGNTGVDGGAIGMNGAATVTISGGTISNNTATNDGGAIVNKGSVTISGGTITGNTATRYGGALLILKDSTTTITGGTFTGNESKRGGAIGTGENVVTTGRPVLNIGGTANFEGNICSEYGGNIYAYTANITISGGTIGTALKGEADAGKGSANIWLRGNSATDLGSTLTITGGSIYGIQATNYTTNVSGNPVIGEINVSPAAMTMSALTSGASIRTAGVGMVTAGDDTVYTTNDRDYVCAADLGFADSFVAGGTVTLTEDTSAGAGVSLTAAGTYTLDLAGYTLTGNAAPYITVGADVKLIITDSVGGGKIVGLTEASAAMIQVNGEFELQGGLLTGHHNNAVKLGAGSTMTMTGGEISGNYANRGAGVTSGDVTGSGVTFTMTGGVIKDNVLTGTSYRGANLYFFDPAMVTLGGDANIGAAYIQDGEALTLVPQANPVYNAEIRGGNAAITGGTYKQLCLSKSSANVTATISGAPVVEMMSANNSTTTIGNLTTGARIATDTNAPLTIAEDDTTVNYTYRLYRFAGDVKSILFVGNSFAGDTTTYLAKIGGYFGNELDAAYLYVGSQNIRWHAQSLAESLRNTDLNGDGVIGDSRDRVDDGLYTCTGFDGYVDIPTVMESKSWDYVVLQPGVEYVGFEGTYNSDIDFLMDYIADVQPDAEILWSQTWAVDNRSWSTQVNPDAPESVEQGGQWVASSSYLTQFGGSQEAMYDAILRNTDEFIAGDDARFAFDGWFPIGIAIQTMRQNYTDSYLTRDGFHLSKNAGRMIAGLTVYKTLFPETDLTALTAADMAAMFDADSDTNVHLNDEFEATEANVATLLAAVETACGYTDTVPTYGSGTANKQFNPDAAGSYVAVYENVTEVGQVATNEKYASTGAGKIVIYKDGQAVSEIDELWLEENAGIVLTDRYANLNGTYYIQADPQAPQLALVGTTLYMTFDVKLYSDEQNTIYNGGVYLTSSTDGVTWTDAVKVSDAPMAYGLTALSDGNLILSVADTTTKAVKISTAGAVVSSVELEDAIADAAFVEVGANTFALTSTGVLYVSTDLGLTWTATGVANGASASPDLIFLNDGDYMTVYATWADEAEMDIYSKVWNVDVTNTTDYGWNDTEASLIAEYAVATAYNGKTTGGQPTTIATSTSAVRGVLKTVYVDGGVLTEADDYTVALRVGRNLALNSSLSINFLVPKTEIDAMEGSYAKIIRSNAAAGVDPVVTIVELAECKTQNVQNAPYYVITFSGLAAKQMSDSVWVAIYNDAGEQVSRLDRYSIRDYATNRFTKNIGAEEKTMLVDMLNYGAAAQNKFNYGVSDLANANLTEAQQALATPELVLDDTLTQNGFVNTSGLRCGKNLTLESVVEMNLNYVKVDVPTASYAVATYTDHNGNSVENRIEFKENTLSGLATHLVVVDTLATADVFTQVTVQVYDANDNVIEGTYCVYSIATYAYNTISKDATSADSVLAMRLMQFGTSAYNSLH